MTTALPIRNGVLVIVGGNPVTIQRQCADIVGIEIVGHTSSVSVHIDHDIVSTADAVRRATGSGLPTPKVGELAALLAKRLQAPLSPALDTALMPTSIDSVSANSAPPSASNAPTGDQQTTLVTTTVAAVDVKRVIERMKTLSTPAAKAFDVSALYPAVSPAFWLPAAVVVGVHFGDAAMADAPPANLLQLAYADAQHELSKRHIAGYLPLGYRFYGFGSLSLAMRFCERHDGAVLFSFVGKDSDAAMRLVGVPPAVISDAVESAAA